MIADEFVRPDAARVLPEALTDLSLRQLLSFRAVALEGSFHGAADALDYTQSAVSQHVAALEAALGVRLFDRGRGRRTVALTEGGRLLLRHVEPIADRLQAARADLLAYAAGETGTLRVAVYQSVGAKALPAVIARFGQAWPGIDVRMTEVLSDDAGLAMVADGSVELAFGILPLPPGPFEGVELLRDPFVLVARPDMPLMLQPGPPTLAQIAEQKLIGFRTCRSTRVAEERLRATGHEPEFVFRSEDNGIVQAMASAGLGVALVPLLTVDLGDPSVRVLPTELEPRQIALVWHRDRYRSPSTLAFSEIARVVCAGLAAELGIGEGAAGGRWYTPPVPDKP
jgi:DNA-binding transcriptional LysR family regulator